MRLGGLSLSCFFDLPMRGNHSNPVKFTVRDGNTFYLRVIWLPVATATERVEKFYTRSLTDNAAAKTARLAFYFPPDHRKM